MDWGRAKLGLARMVVGVALLHVWPIYSVLAPGRLTWAPKGPALFVGAGAVVNRRAGCLTEQN